MTSQDLRGIWGTSADNLYVAGRWGAFYHFDGNAWGRPTEMPWQIEHWHGLWVTPESEVVAVGEEGVIIMGTR
jgi:prolipoprotein diacylglyceryltransferase